MFIHGMHELMLRLLINTKQFSATENSLRGINQSEMIKMSALLKCKYIYEKMLMIIIHDVYVQ